jgi:chromosome segregation ATPase
MTVDLTQLLTILAVVCGPGGLAVAFITRKRTNVLATIQESASRQVERLEAEAVHWKTECSSLRAMVVDLEGKVDAQDACQTTLRAQLTQLEVEKRALLEEVGKLRNRVQLLEEENQRLKCIADKVAQI